MIDVSAASGAFQIRRILLLRGSDIQAVMVGVIEEVALDAPNLVVHLIPLDAGIGVDLHAVEIQSAIAGLGHDCLWRDEPPRALAIQNLFAMGRNHKAVQTSKERFRLASAEIKL